MIRFLSALAVTSLLVSCGGDAADPGKTTPKVSAKDFKEAYMKGADFLAGKQHESGAWTQTHPQAGEVPSLGFTGLAVAALAGGPAKEKYSGAVEKGMQFLLSKQSKADGSFGEGRDGEFLKSYGTAIALMAMAAADRKKYSGQIRAAQAYLKNNQVVEGTHKGGSGYGDNAPGKDKPTDYANMATTGFAAEGLHASGLPKDDKFWKLVVDFCRKIQNSAEVNTDEAWLKKLKDAGLSIGDDGGLFYTPIADAEKASKAGTKKLVDKEVILSYGSMTYDGIKTYIYAGLPKDSPEVSAAMDWVRKNYTVEVHPGMPFDSAKRSHMMGVYYYYVVMAKALDAFGENPLKTFDGKSHDWAAELGGQLVKLQKADGSWSNENPRWYENVPQLTTSYCLITGNVLLRNLK